MGRGPGVRAVGVEAIQIDFRWKGQRCRERVRLRPTSANLKYCAGWKRRIEEEIAHGTFDYSKHFPDSPRSRRDSSGGEKLGCALHGYCQSLAHSVEPETVREYCGNAAIVAKGLGNPTVAETTRAKIREWVSKQTLSKARIDNLLKPLRGYFGQAVEDGVLTTNPLEGFKVKRVGEVKGDIDPFTPEEIEALGGTALGALWTAWAWTGLRSGEIIGLAWNDVDLKGCRLHVRRAVRLGRTKSPKTKSGERSISLLPAARLAIEGLERQEIGGPVFRNPNTGNGWHEAKALNRAFARACEEAQVRRRYVYQLRHTFATWALSSGENPAWIARQMGHTSAQMLYQHYGRWMPQLDPQAGSRMLAKAVRGQEAA